MIVFSIVLFVLSIYIFLSYLFDWEFSKKYWQKGIPYSKYDKILGNIIAIIGLVLSILIFINSFSA